ncbi:MAG: SURF1 family protein [Pseudomonadota bacterium]
MTRTRGRQRPFWVDAVVLSCVFVIFVTLVGLGVWQVQRLYWKLDLIEAVESRANANPIEPPEGPVSSETHAYLRVAVPGTFHHQMTRRIKAITELGPGHWVLTPLQVDWGHIWVNRGFVPAGTEPSQWNAPAGPVPVFGLLRITEPDGTLLEKNDPAKDRWVSRDVAALSRAAGLSDAASYFIDADHSGSPDAWPRGGLTIVNFRNPHLSYALTWFAMAALFLGGIAYVIFGRLYHTKDGSTAIDDECT